MGTPPWSVILDPRRLSDLRDLKILDTQPEQSYDDLAELARMICDTPVANVTLVDTDRQWFKSRIGSDVEQTPVEQSVCAHAIAEPHPLIINDLTRDPRTSDNPLVTGEASLRFYAGVPLHLEASFGVGTLCVLDTKPHHKGLTAAQVKALDALGRQATILLHMRRFLASHANAADGHSNMDEALLAIAEKLMDAYNMNRTYDDRTIERLLSSSLLHVAKRIADGEKRPKTHIH
ncbi:GAF domain-containing protein [Methylobacterium sp. A54F]